MQNLQRTSTSLRFSPELCSWLFVELAPVLFSSKAGELLNFDSRAHSYTPEAVAEVLSALSEQWMCETETMYRDEVSQKVLVYVPQRVEDALDEVPSPILEEVLNYKGVKSAQDFVQAVSLRWRRAHAIPHEIGFALGYPVEDVLGYMQLNDLPYGGSCGWCAYGDTTRSFARSNEYSQAKRAASLLVHASEPRGRSSRLPEHNSGEHFFREHLFSKQNATWVKPRLFSCEVYNSAITQ